ncbi:MAG: delta-60 repeat domain-containing protein [Flavobacterium sp.]|nr:delta-60 repeat domain-containing protein [Flavobacterium sp.]
MKTKLLIIVLILLKCSVSHAQPGEIDNSFNFSGIGAYGTWPLSDPPTVDQGKVDAVVYTSAVYGANSIHKDKIIIGGRFTSYNGVQVGKIARLNPDGTLDETFNPSVEFTSTGHYIYCSLALSDGSVILGGQFNLLGYTNIIKLQPNGDVDPTFMAFGAANRGFNGLVHALAADGNKIMVGGNFQKIYKPSGDIAVKRLVRLMSNGEVDYTFDNRRVPSGSTPGGDFDAEIRSITVQKPGTSDARYLIGGFFSKYTYNNIDYVGRFFRFMKDGSFDESFHNNVGVGPLSPAEHQLAVFDSEFLPNIQTESNSKILVGGSFKQWKDGNGTTHNIRGIIRLNENGQVDATFNLGGSGTGRGTNPSGSLTVFAIQMQPDGKIILGGSLNGYNGIALPKGIVRLMADGTLDPLLETGEGFYSGTGVYGGAGTLRNIQLQSDGKIICSGDFTHYDGNPRRMIARIKTRECFNAGLFYEETGWDNGANPETFDNTYYMVINSGTVTIPSGQHWVACELEIKPGATLIIDQKASLTVKGIVMNNGTFHVEDSGSLVQIEEDAINADLGVGTFTLTRKTTPVKKFDFTYWSSPVEEQTLFDLSPFTLSDKYFEFNATTNSWLTPVGGSSAIMEQGKGYIIRAPQTFSATIAAVFTATFEGRPHNGMVKNNVRKSGTNTWNLLGNPYPSAIDANLFLDHNSTKIGGTIYLWTHNTAVNPSTGAFQYTSDDYAVYNRTGTVNTSPTGVTFAGKIASGQGFFVASSVNSGQVEFTNAMRVTSVNNNNSQFYRLSDASASAETTIEGEEKHRIWLNLVNDQGAFKQTLVAYASGATNEFDRSYDAMVFNANSFVNLYSIANQENLAIQGKALPFSYDDVIPLGYSSTLAGQFAIELGNFDGMFTTEGVYLLDKDLNVMHNLKNGSYSFTTAVGTFDQRFELRFMNESLSTDENMLDENAFKAFAENSVINLQSTINIVDVRVYDVAGRLLAEKTGLNAMTFSTSLTHADNNVVIVKAKLDNNQEVIRKMVLK